jgi:16S rRNA (adenine1518-N6/adenine1519-N6)-dimethyltransferase
VVTAAFSQRRKTLANALRRLLGRDEITGLGLDPRSRAETVSPAQFAQLANHLSRRERAGPPSYT